MQQQRGKPEECGALWKKEDKNGNSYLSGTVKIEGKEYRIFVQKNNFKKSPTQPDFRISNAGEVEPKPAQQQKPFQKKQVVDSDWP